MVLNAIYCALSGKSEPPRPFVPDPEELHHHNDPHPEGNLPHDPPDNLPPPSPEDAKMIFWGCVTLLIAVTLICIFGSKETAMIALAALLPLTSMMYNQWRVARKSDEARVKLAWEIRRSKHDIKDDVNYVALMLQDKDQAQTQLRELIKVISEEVRKAEREQFWTDPEQQRHLKTVMEDVLEGVIDKNCEKVAKQAAESAIKDYHQQHRPDEPL
jgi:hypothetical protein